MIRLRVSPTISWDFESNLHSYTLVVRGTDFPGGTPQLQVRVFKIPAFYNSNMVLIIVLDSSGLCFESDSKRLQ